MLYLFGGSKQRGAVPGRVSLSVDWQKGVDFEAVYLYLLQLAVKGKVEGVVASMPQLDKGFLKVCALMAVAQAARDKDKVFLALAAKPPRESGKDSWCVAGLGLLGDLHVAEAKGLEFFRDSQKGLGGRAVDEVLDSVASCMVGNDGPRDLEVHTSSWRVYEHLHLTQGVSATDLARVLSVARGEWVRDPELVVTDGYEREGLLLDLVEAALAAGEDEAKLAKAFSLEAFKSHVLADHKPYRSDCKVCLESRSRNRKHVRLTSGPVNTLSADIAGPFPAGLDVVKDARLALVTVFSQAVTDGDPKDPLPSYDEGLELLEEEGVPEAEELPSEREPRDADVKEACQEPVRTRNFIQVVPLARKNHHQVLLGLQKCYTRLRRLGFSPSRFHSDRGKEFICELVTRWALARDMWKTTASGDDPAANGKVERAVGLFKEGCRQLLHSAGLEPLLRVTGLRPVSARQVPLQVLLCLSLFPFGSKFMVRKRSWHLDSWSTRVCPARVLGPSPDLPSGYRVLPENPEDGKKLLISNVLFSQVRTPEVVTLDGVVETADPGKVI